MVSGRGTKVKANRTKVKVIFYLNPRGCQVVNKSEGHLLLEPSNNTGGCPIGPVVGKGTWFLIGGRPFPLIHEMHGRFQSPKVYVILRSPPEEHN